MLLLMFSCNERKHLHTLVTAEQYLPERPDSADSLLKTIVDYERLNDSDKALYGLLRTYTDNRQGRGVKSDSLIRQSYLYYKGKSDEGECSDSALISRYASSCYYMGLYYSSCDSVKQCEDLMRESIKLSGKCHDWHTCYLAYIILSNCMRESDSEYAKRLAFKALDTYNKINDDLSNKILIYGKIAECYGWCSDLDSSLYFFNKGYNLAKKHGITQSQNTMCMGIAGVYWMAGEYDNSLKYAKQGIETADEEILTNSEITLALCYLANDSINKAKEVFMNIRCDSDDYINKSVIHKHLIDIAILQNDYNSISNHIDSVYNNLEKKYFRIQEVKNEYYKENIKSFELKEKLAIENERDKWIIISITALLCLVSIFSYYLIKSKHNLSVEKNKVIELKDNLIRQKAVSLSLVQQHLVSITNELKNVFTKDGNKLPDSLWIQAENVLDDTDCRFVSNLRKNHPEFKESDVRLCMALRLKLTNEQIAKMFNITVSAVKKRKSTLKKTGFIVDDPAVSLNNIIETI